jgi:hypothetical protein
MNVRRDFLLVATLAAATATPVSGQWQTMTPAQQENIIRQKPIRGTNAVPQSHK